MEELFKPGDRVVVDTDRRMDGKYLRGKRGTVLKIIHHIDHIDSAMVEFDDDIGGHSASGTGKDRHCWSIFLRYLAHDEELRVPTMKEVLNLFNLHDGDEFEVAVLPFVPYHIKDGNVLDRDDDRANDILWECMENNEKIKRIKHPFPSINDVYYFVDVDGLVYPDEFTKNAKCIALLSMGNCFRTRASAEEHKEEMMDKMSTVLGGQDEENGEDKII